MHKCSVQAANIMLQSNKFSHRLQITCKFTVKVASPNITVHALALLSLHALQLGPNAADGNKTLRQRVNQTVLTELISNHDIEHLSENYQSEFITSVSDHICQRNVKMQWSPMSLSLGEVTKLLFRNVRAGQTPLQ